MKFKYVSKRSITEFITAIQLTNQLRIYMEMCKNLIESQNIRFGLAIDAGSTCSKSKVWVGFLMKKQRVWRGSFGLQDKYLVKLD